MSMRSASPIMCLAAAALLAMSGPSWAEDGEASDSAAQDASTRGAPALVVAISVDQFSADLFAQYRGTFTGGLARMQQGAVFPSGFQSHAATETCPGHSTILTGVRPARSGIVANNWYDPGIKRADKRIYCAEDESDPQSSSDDPVSSAVHLKVPTLGELLKQRDAKSRNVAVAGKDRAALMMGGTKLDAVYWWKGPGFATLKGRKAGKAASEVNAQLAKAIAAGAPSFAVPQWCEAPRRAVPVGGFTVGDYTFAVPPGQPAIYGRTPHQDAAVGDLAIKLVDEERLGRDASPDVLSVSFSVTDYVGHAFGTEGAEMCIQLAELDRTLGKLFDDLDARGIDYVAVLTADHGGIDLPERLREQGYPQAQRLDPALQTKSLERAVTDKTNITVASGPLLYGGAGNEDIYLSHELSPADRTKVIGALVELLRANPQVKEVFTSEELAGTPLPSGSPQDWTLLQRARSSFNAQHSGDLTVMLVRGVVPVKPRPGITATHGSPWDYDRRVPILFWRKDMAGLEQPAPVETVDIAPTLAALLGLNVAKGQFDGRCLDIDGAVADICR